ncbi:tyrosine-protein phosphatase non-receptor type 18 isoform X2 [Xiphias gladius]|uniref:tyrosine-protein phosphatase non-receptor type 18 isoform X2 n=1 Tax=Xiphias gladius TaxID=8245 RepID=UPI001A99258A|nr:tyrosine-protein phosphatase non-receptor type 18 isoform X2 [Xiphias gladius]
MNETSRKLFTKFRRRAQVPHVGSFYSAGARSRRSRLARVVVRSQTLLLKRHQGLTSEAGVLKENVKKNRYKDIVPYDQSRVVLSLVTTDSDSDYINASFIKGPSADNKYIASQGPLSSTLTDFWRMIWQNDIKVIVMACREIEMGKRKCECYWAPVHQSAAFGPFTVINQEETRPSEGIVIRTLTVTYQQVSRSVIQYQFLSWPDHDVPYQATGVLDLLERARNSQGTHTSPVLIHCSAGCGRTGVICALDYIHDLLVTKVTEDFSIMKIVLELRRQRPSAVQTRDQYQFIFTAAACMFERVLQSTGHQLYCNTSELKKPEKKTTITPASSTKRSSKLIDMNDTYAVVNKTKHPQPTPTSPANSAVTPPRSSRTLPSSHHYDNDPAGASAAPVYSAVRPRAKMQSLPLSTTAIYDTATSANHRPGEELPSLHNSGEHHLPAAKQLSATDDDYEDFSSSVTDVSSFCAPGGIGFNCRIQKPRGPREPPAEWSRVER